MSEHIDYQFRVSYIVIDPDGNQVWASNYKHLAEAEADGRNRNRPGHTVVERKPGETD